MTDKKTDKIVKNLYEFEARVASLKLALDFSKEYGDLTAKKWEDMSDEKRLEEFHDLFDTANIFKEYLLKE